MGKRHVAKHCDQQTRQGQQGCQAGGAGAGHHSDDGVQVVVQGEARGRPLHKVRLPAVRILSDFIRLYDAETAAAIAAEPTAAAATTAAGSAAAAAAAAAAATAVSTAAAANRRNSPRDV